MPDDMAMETGACLGIPGLTAAHAVLGGGDVAGMMVLSLTGYFSIPKGEGDMRMVYDATKCKLNDALWAPSFWLPTAPASRRNTPCTASKNDTDAWMVNDAELNSDNDDDSNCAAECR